MMGLIFKKEGLIKALAAISAAGGSEPAEAQLVAENLVIANLTGHDSHGIGMMPRYVEALLEGGLHPNRKLEVKLDAGALLALDGGAGYGQSIGLQATRLAIERAQRHGMSITALVAMSRRNGGSPGSGMPMHTGLVPKRPSAPP